MLQANEQPVARSKMMELTDRAAGKPVLVTGASGFIGAHLCHRLITCGAVLHAVSRELRRSTEHLQWWQADLKDVAGVREVFRS